MILSTSNMVMESNHNTFTIIDNGLSIEAIGLTPLKSVENVEHEIGGGVVRESSKSLIFRTEDVGINEENAATPFSVGTDCNGVDSIHMDLPTWRLPEIFKDFVNEGSKVYGNPASYWVAAIFAAISASVRKSVILCDGKFENFPQLYLCMVGRPGIGKTVCVDKAFESIYRKDLESHNRWLIEMKMYEDSCKAGASMKKPILRTILANDVTIERLYVKLSENDESTSIVRDELNGWFANWGIYSKGSEVERYLELFNNQHTSIERISRETVMLSKPFLSIFGGIQPKVLTTLLSKDCITGNGMVQRFLWVYPDGAVAQKRNQTKMAYPIQSSYNHRINQLIQLGESGSVEYRLTDDAEALYDDFTSWIADQVNASSDDYWCAVLEKMNIHCLRLALIVAVARYVCHEEDESDAPMVHADDIRYAWECCKYFLWSAIKVQNLVSERNRNSVTRMTNEALIAELANRYPAITANKAQFGRALGISRPLISRCLKLPKGAVGTNETEEVSRSTEDFNPDQASSLVN